MVDPSQVTKVKLNNGIEMPVIGLGTWQSPHEDVYEAVKTAIEVGYRHIDCAYCYGNEVPVGRAIKDAISEGKVKREDLFVVSKVWLTFFTRERVREGLKRSLTNLGLDYLDLYLVHWPISFQQVDEKIFPADANGLAIDGKVDYLDTWKGMEDVLKDGLVKSIGVSNFNSEQVTRVLNNSSVKPVTNQVESHPYLAQKQLLKFCREKGIPLTAYSPLGNPGSAYNTNPNKKNILNDTLVSKLATKYKKTAGQILIKFQAQRGVIVIPKSVKRDRIVENIQIFDFELNADEITALENLDFGYRSCPGDPGADLLPNYPFHIPY
ncbi:aldo-keto reductase family 1 member B10-like [Bradysia coprophila]|uniref:aldo-keto reductase family 1 member B10-like n=1 Tax=Bradysia coprophila TaxID=38358 RepID=UPI00187DBEA2|nr:aldo-keto reductase family 1 member B10-like [Bradysia coprophila]